MKNQILKPTLFVGALALFTACNQNPFTDQPLNERRQTQHSVDPLLSVEGPDTVSCYEGTLCQAQFAGHVSSGNAVIEFTGLPDGAVFDPSTNSLTYTPDYTVVDPSSDESTSKTFTAQRTVYSDSNPTVTKVEEFNVTVINVMRETTVTMLSGNNVIAEGDSIDQVIEVKNADFPKGPFALNLGGAPESVTVTPVDGTPSQFKVHFKTTVDTVTANDTANSDGIYQKIFNVAYVGTTPLGHPGKFYKTWTVSDSRKVPLVIAPDNYTSGAIVSFPISATDLNNEVAPTITIDPATVPFGRLTVTPITQTGSAYTTMVQVKWDQITPDHLDTATPTPIIYVVCVQPKAGVSYCNSKTTLVTLTATKN